MFSRHQLLRLFAVAGFLTFSFRPVHAGAEIRFAPPESPVQPASVDRDLFSLVGVEHFYASHGNRLALQTLERLNLAGTQARLEINMDRLEPVNDNNDPFTINWSGYKFDNLFPGVDDSRRFVQELKELGFEPYFLFAYNTKWLGEGNSVTGPPTDYDEWSEYVVATLEYFNGKPGTEDYKPLVQYVEIWNEPAEQGLYWDGDRFQYYRMYNNAADRIRARFPDVRIGGPTLLNTEPIFLKDFLQECGHNADFIANHIYNTSPALMEKQIVGWMDYARQVTRNPNLTMNLSETDDWHLLGAEKADYLLERQFRMLGIQDYLHGFQHFCAHPFSPGQTQFGLVYHEGGVIEKNYWTYWLFRNLRGERLSADQPDTDEFFTAAAHDSANNVFNAMVYDKNGKEDIELAISLPADGVARFALLETIRQGKPGIEGFEILDAGATEARAAVEGRGDSVAASLTVRPVEQATGLIAIGDLEAESPVMGGTAVLRVKVLNPLPYPVSGDIRPAGMPKHWTARAGSSGSKFTPLGPGETFETAFTISLNSPTEGKHGTSMYAEVNWRRGLEEGQIATIPRQLSVEPPLEFDPYPSQLTVRPVQIVPVPVAIRATGESRVEGRLGLELPRVFKNQEGTEPVDFAIEKGSQLEHAFNLRTPPTIAEGEYPASVTVWIDGVPLRRPLKIVVRSFEDQQGIVPLDLWEHFNADSLTFLGSTSDVGNFGGPFSIPAEYFPPAGSFDFLGVRFQMPVSRDGMDNCIRTGAQRIDVPDGTYKALHMIATATNGGKDLIGRGIYSDGREQAISFRVSNWTSPPSTGEEVVFRAPYRHEPMGDLWDAEPAIFMQSAEIPVRREDLVEIVLPPEEDLFIYALSLQRGAPPANGEAQGTADDSPVGPVPALQGETLFQADFSSDNWKDAWMEMGAVAPFNEIRAANGKLEIEGGIGGDWFGLINRKKVDLADGPVQLRIVYRRAEETKGTENCFWFVDQVYQDKNPWNRENFIRLQIVNWGPGPDMLNVQRDFGKGAGKLLGQTGGLQRGRQHTLEWTLSEKAYWVEVDGTLAVSGRHDLENTSGYFYLTDYNSLEGDVDTISEFEIRR